MTESILWLRLILVSVPRVVPLWGDAIAVVITAETEKNLHQKHTY